jgi:hypothetical protein
MSGQKAGQISPNLQGQALNQVPFSSAIMSTSLL